MRQDCHGIIEVCKLYSILHHERITHMVWCGDMVDTREDLWITRMCRERCGSLASETLRMENSGV